MLSILFTAVLAQATTTTPSPAPQVPIEVVGPQQPRRVCRIERDTTSRIASRRICQTVHEREAERDENQREAERTVNRQWDRQMGDQPFPAFAQPGGGIARGNGSPQ